MNIGDVVQTQMYARRDYAGRKMKIINIQNDIEQEKSTAIGFLVLKNGQITKTIVSIFVDQLSVIKKPTGGLNQRWVFMKANRKKSLR